MSEPLKSRFASIRTRFESAKLTEFALPLFGLLIIVGAVVGAETVGNVRNNAPAKVPVTPVPTKSPLSISHFTPFTPKTFKVVIQYDVNADRLELKELSVISDDITSDLRLASQSPYQIAMVNKNGGSIYKSRVTINELLIIDSMIRRTAPSELVTRIYLPYNKETAKIIVYKDDMEIFSVPISQVEIPTIAEPVQTQSCDPVTVAIISDGYTDMNEFRNHADQVTSVFPKVAPYSNFPELFAFKIYENKEDLGCSKDNVKCINSQTLQNAVEKARASTGASTAIVLSKGGGTPGVAFFGGSLSVVDTISAARNYTIADTAVHEFLGHSVGYLYDRYIADNIVPPLSGKIRSNCTDNPNGESFWKGAGGGVHPGCGRSNYYAPYPATCGAGGNPLTAMGTCNDPSRPQFDAVEQAWISNYILPNLTCNPVPPPAGSPWNPGGTNPGSGNPGSGGTNPGTPGGSNPGSGNPGNPGGANPGTPGGSPGGYSITSGMADNLNYPGGDFGGPRTWDSPSPQDCQTGCAEDTACLAWTWVKPGIQGTSGVCWLKDGSHGMCYRDSNTVSGAKPADVNNTCPIGPHGNGGPVPLSP